MEKEEGRERVRKREDIEEEERNRKQLVIHQVPLCGGYLL